MLAITGDHRSGIGQRKSMDPVGSVDLLWVSLVNDDRGLITTPVIVFSPLERKTQARSANNSIKSGRLVLQACVWEQAWKKETYPTLGSTLPVGSFFVAITTVHLRVPTTDERRIRHRFVAFRRLGRRGSILRRRGAVRRRSRFDRRDRIRARTQGARGRRSRAAVARHLGVRYHLDSHGDLSRSVAHGRYNNNKRTNDG